ncbi:E3 ubiquitin-protein ligase znrf2 [Hymenolepis weldensis]
MSLKLPLCRALSTRLQRFSRFDQTCPYCKRLVPGDDFELHFTMCLTRPRVTYNEDTLQSDKGECSICLEDMKAGDKIARLPCLCIYHKHPGLDGSLDPWQLPEIE